MAKTFGGLSILISIITALLGGISVLIPLSFFSVENTSTLGMSFLIGLFIGNILALITGLVGYYLIGAFGDNLFSILSKILGVLLTIGAFVLGILIIFKFEVVVGLVIYDTFNLIRGLIIILIFLSPIILMFIPIVVKKVSIWKRFALLISYVLFISIPIVVGILLFVLSNSLGEDSLVYSGIREATFPQLLSLGTIAWSFLGISALTNESETGELK